MNRRLIGITVLLCFLTAAASVLVTKQLTKTQHVPQTSESSTAEPADPDDLLNADSYQQGYDAGFAEGLEQGEAEQRLAGEQDAEQAYEEGYREGYDAGRQDAHVENVRISGSFTASLNAVIPDTITGGSMAAVALFQDAPMLIGIDTEQVSSLTVGETYTFVLEEQEIHIYGGQFYSAGSILSSDALNKKQLKFAEIRTPHDDEYGLECFRVDAEAVSDPV